MSKFFEFEKKDFIIYKKEIRDFIPDKIFDSHIHIWKKDDLLNSNSNNEELKKCKPFTNTDYMGNSSILIFMNA